MITEQDQPSRFTLGQLMIAIAAIAFALALFGWLFKPATPPPPPVKSKPRPPLFEGIDLPSHEDGRKQ